MSNLAIRVSNIGIHPEMPYLLQKRIQFTNLLCLFFIPFILFLIIYGILVVDSIPLAVTFLAYWIVPAAVFFFNYIGKQQVGRFLFIPATCLYLIIANVATHQVFHKTGIDPGILNLYMFRHYYPAALMALLILLDAKEESSVFIGATSISLFFTIFFFKGMEVLGFEYTQFESDKLNIPMNEFFFWTNALIVLSEVLFLKNINSNFERKFLTQNAELESQKEEISAINDQLKDQKEEITMQRDVLEKVHSNLMSSINYAQRIQDALLPTRELLKDWLPSHFILFKPRDVVSGDFYWAASRDNRIFWICGDCTGHGVPGAFMTVVGMNLLHQIIMEEGENDPSTILLRLNRRLEQSLRHEEATGKKVADGMDLALVVIDTQAQTFQFAGAKRPLYFFPKGGELEKVKGSKYAIGGGRVQGKIFDKHAFTFTPGDRIFLFSDGYPDQYGGTENRKFMVKQFRELICDVQSHPMEKQASILEDRLEAWRGSTRQTDDILVMGMEF